MISSLQTTDANGVTLPDSKRTLLLVVSCLLLLAQALPLIHTRWIEDESWYSASADSLARHGELRMRIFSEEHMQGRVDTRMPLTAMILAGCFKVFGTSLYTAKLPFLLSALAGILLTYLLGCELGGPLLGALGALFVATDNLYFLAARTARPEAIVMALDAAAILLFLISQRRRSTAYALASGLVTGLATLAHPAGLAPAFTAAILACIEFRGTVLFRARTWAFAAGVVLPAIPFVLWATSDAVHRDEFVRLYSRGQGFPLSAIPSLERSRWADFIGMPNSRFRLPVPLPYRLHVALALIAATAILFRHNRRLLGTLSTILVPCILWWAFLRNPTSRYIAIGGPYLALLLAGGVIALWARRPHWRSAVAAAALLLIFAQVAGNYFILYLYRKGNYSQVTRELRAIIPRDAKVYGALTFWMSFHDQRYFSWNRAPLQYSLERGANYLILNDRVLVNGSGFGLDDWDYIRKETSEFVSRHATLVGRAPNAFYGDLEIYRVNGR